MDTMQANAGELKWPILKEEDDMEDENQSNYSNFSNFSNLSDFMNFSNNGYLGCTILKETLLMIVSEV